MATNIQLTGIKQLPPIPPISEPAKVQIEFNVLGFLPDSVQIYASGRSGDLGSFIEDVDMKPPENSYIEIIELPAGTPLFIALCPRVKQDNGQLDDEINGQAWGASCVWAAFTTQAHGSPPPDRPKPPTPRILPITEWSQATLQKAGEIIVRWEGSSDFDFYQFMARELPYDWGGGVDVNSGGGTGYWTYTPATAGRTYSFKVSGCYHHKFLWVPTWDECSLFSNAPTNFLMPSNTHSLREFLRLSDAHLNPGIRSLGQAAYGAGIRAMMHL